MNHNKNFVKPGTTGSTGVHTENIEGRWHCVKRWLPTSGRYKVDEYLPVYLWTVKLKKENKSLF